MKKDILADLNEQQKEAVTTTEGPVLIFAGASSGKTKALTHRISYLIKQKKAAAAEILAVTFTNKAAGEMVERVAKLLDLPLAKKTDFGSQTHAAKSLVLPWMGTFHSICVRVLRQDGANIGVKPNFIIYDEDDSLSLVRKILKELKLDEKKMSARSILSLISSAKNELIKPDQYAEIAQGILQEAAASVYHYYQLHLSEADALDFDDLIMRTIDLFTENANVLSKYGKQFKYILVDEYQDTNYSQYMLVRLLAKSHGNLCVVGDEDQAIYTWRGADYRNIMNFEKDWKNTKVILMEKNYRSTKNVIEAAQNVISKNINRSSKKLWTEKEDGEPIQLYVAGNETDEANFVTEEVNKLLRAGQSLGDCAVLYRTHAQSRVLEEACLMRGIPYQIIGGLRFYERREIKDLVAYLRLFSVDADLVGLRRVVNVPGRGVGAKTLEKIEAILRESKDVVTALRGAVEREKIMQKTKDALSALANLIERGRVLKDEMSPSDIVLWLIKELKYKDFLRDTTVNFEERIENIEELISASGKYGVGETSRFLEEVALLSSTDEARGGEALTLMTLHSAKGLEFEAVFIMGVEEGLFPHSRSLFEQAELEEERRLAYVGITRAKRLLFLSYANSRVIFGQVRSGMPSRFLEDIPEGLINEIRSGEVDGSINLRRGDLVRHEIFGIGKIVTLDGDEALIHFETGGKKRVALLMAPIEKVEQEDLEYL